MEAPGREAIYSNKYGEIIGYDYHYGVKVGDTIYDNLTLEGMSFDKWLSDIGADGSVPSITYRIVETSHK